MSRYHKIVIDGDVRFREFNEATGYYKNEALSEEEVVEQLLEEAIEEMIEVDKARIERAISTIPYRYQRETVQTYLDYIERLVETFK